MSKPTISIIVPVYKAEKYLSKCIESILNQTYKDFELILIDDGSPDNSGQICDEFANKDNRIVVIHQENKGVSAARNAGIKISKGVWLTFIDADDYIETNHLLIFYENAIINEDCEMIEISHRLLTLQSKASNDISIKKSNLKDAIDFLTSQVWNYFFRNSIIKENNISFALNLKYAEDIVFICEYLSMINYVLLIDSQTYIYNNNNVSATTNISVESNDNHLRSAELLIPYKEKIPEIITLFIYDLITRYIFILCNNKRVSLKEKINIYLHNKNVIVKLQQSIRSFLPFKRRLLIRYPYLFFIRYLFKHEKR